MLYTPTRVRIVHVTPNARPNANFSPVPHMTLPPTPTLAMHNPQIPPLDPSTTGSDSGNEPDQSDQSDHDDHLNENDGFDAEALKRVINIKQERLASPEPIESKVSYLQ